MQAASMKAARNIAIVYAESASASRSAAVALQKALQLRQPQCQVRLVKITSFFDYHRVFGPIVRTGMNRMSSLAHDLVGEKGIQKIAAYWKLFLPDIVISVAPIFNPVLYRSAQLANPAVQCITIPVDLEEVGSRTWFTPSIKQYYLNATDLLDKQAAEAGIPADYRFRISGLPVAESAYEPRPRNRDWQLKAIGLNPAWPVGFISFGIQGSPDILQITRALAKQHQQLNLIIMCGKNKKLFRQLTTTKIPFPTAVYYYLPQTPVQYLQLADFAIGKPGAMTITESLITRTPLIVQKSKNALHKGNEAWLTKTRTGIVSATPAGIAARVNEIISNPSYKEQLAIHHHQAIYEIAALIEQIAQLEQRMKKAA
ncbi:glycosyltransferase [Niastella vici]|nr:glycosyltransferase [Niastella vici]